MISLWAAMVPVYTGRLLWRLASCHFKLRAGSRWAAGFASVFLTQKRVPFSLCFSFLLLQDGRNNSIILKQQPSLSLLSIGCFCPAGCTLCLRASNFPTGNDDTDFTQRGPFFFLFFSRSAAPNTDPHTSLRLYKWWKTEIQLGKKKKKKKRGGKGGTATRRWDWTALINAVELQEQKKRLPERQISPASHQQEPFVRRKRMLTMRSARERSSSTARRAATAPSHPSSMLSYFDVAFKREIKLIN